MIQIQKFVFSPFMENTFVVWDGETKDAVIIDPGCFNTDEENKLSEFIESNSLTINYLINTHCHIDHIFGNAYIKEKYNCSLIIPEKDVFLIDKMQQQADKFQIKFIQSPQPDDLITHESTIQIGNTN